MTKLTKEQLSGLARENVRVLTLAAKQHPGQPVIAMDLRLAEIALAALTAGMEQEPVAWMTTRDGDGTFPRLHLEEAAADCWINTCNVAPPIAKHALYAAPQLPQPAVPDDVLKRIEHEANHVTAFHHIDEHSCKVNRRDLLTMVNACRAAMLQGVEPVTTAYKLPELRYLDTVKFNADCALQDPESIYAQEFFMSLDEVFGERGNYTDPVQAKAVSILIAEIFRLRGYPVAPQQEASKSNVIGTYQGADGRDHPIVNLSAPQQETN